MSKTIELPQLRSYLCGGWTLGSGPAQTLFNPATEEALATLHSAGHDISGALDYARREGGKALRALTFAERGALLKAIADGLQEHRPELLELGISNGGNTRSDAKFDVDGAIATLLAYAEIGAGLGTARFLVDGEGIQLGRSPRFHGQHVAVPRHGVAVHINAFNFPAWGFAEKAAVALLAGMPVLSKPATSSALLAHRVVEIIVDKKILPSGALSFLAGAPGELLSHLGPQDVVAFTGSGTTAERIRSMPNVIRHSVRVNVEADSLNAAVLGPDVKPGSEMFETFVRDVVRDMTQKAGQKCTAIRRVLVPVGMGGDVKSSLAELLAAVTVGDPSIEGIRMGPVATASQREDVRSGIAGLLREGSKAFEHSTLPAKGYYVGPTLVEAAESASAVHEREVFGPVATLIAYVENPEQIVTSGNGGLVCSIYSDDQEFIETVAMEIAPHHGRIFLGHPKIELSPGPGTVLPQLVHGGPGRAGGGEELGGPRGLYFYMQRVALQGSRPVIQKLLERRN
ncbi:MAG TPA: 3,4-dehydroadipyl-CoA semialdehyde dehydrogenase [Burkholderiales bacterium]|nr:3,4-dehydroadipyl-CoA semialdehyde dehydrogenase [Burkholderiales bacterium]